MKYKKLLAVFLTILTVLTVFSLSASALSWDGSSAGGSTNAVNGSSTGYVIRSTNDSNCVVGYRFSVVNSSGSMKVNKVIDVFRNTGNGDNAYSSSAKFTAKYNKKQLIANKNAKLTTSQNTTNCYKESSMSFVSTLPNPSGVETWQTYEGNINKVLTKIGVGTVSNMVYGDKVIIEPLFDICLAGEYQALTVTEIAYCGRSVKGGSSDGGTSNGTSSTWGFIANYTNRIWPNKLYTPDGQGLWTAASAIGSSTKATFNNILTKGYGAGIAYNETANITYTIKFNGNGSTSGSTASMSMVKDVAQKLTANGFKRTGYTFKNWNKKADGSSTSYTNKQSVKNLSSKQGATVNLYAQWTPNTYTIKFNGNGNTGGSTASMSMTYDVAKKLTANGFTKTGYTFSGWNTKSGGSGTSYTNKQSVKNLTSTDGGTVTLYAQWAPNKYTVAYNANGGSGAPSSQTKTYGVDLTLSSTKPTRTGYTFSKWNTKADGSGTNYSSGAKHTGNANLTLYAKWMPNTYTVTYNANGGSGAPSSQKKTYGVNLTLSSAKPTRTGYTFNGWNTNSNGTGTNYASGGTYSANASVTLYAKWTPNTYTVKYYLDGVEQTSLRQSCTYGTTYSYKSLPTKSGYTVSGWWSGISSSSRGTQYTAGSSFSNLTTTSGGTVNRYAYSSPITYAIRFDGNGSTGGSTASMTMTFDAQKALTANGFTRIGYRFVCWSIVKDGQGPCYADKQIVKNMTDVNGGVVTLYAQWEADRILSLEPVTPNAAYREGTDVITSFNLVNEGTQDCLSSDNVSVVFKVYKDSTCIKTVTKEKVVVPGNDKNLLYFKWTVPENIGSSTISISGEIVENGSSYSLVKKAYETTKYIISSTPDTQYAISAPSGFIRPSVPAESNTAFTWSEWKYENGTFRKVNYGIGISNDSVSITPDESANATKSSGVWIMKSGYGFGISLSNGVKSLSGYTMPSSDAYTVPQYSTAQFPEFSYLTSVHNFRTLELSSGNWIFRDNADYGKIHFTPLWYPDGSYTVSVTQSDMWTPAGMITRKVSTNSIIIKGSAYDDWYI